jgi:HTH-type transcriptional regulator / antitoxin HigA
MITKITTEKDYQIVLDAIEMYLKKGSTHLSGEEKKELLRLSLMTEAYEQAVYPMPIPSKTIVGMIQIKMFERQLKQKDLALILNVSETTLSEIMNGKRKINLPLAQQLYQKLNISADFILQNA